MKGSPTDAEAKASPNALFGAREPNLSILHEKPEHRIILYLKSQGYSNREVAHKTGYTEAWLSQLTRQPWFQKRLMDILSEAGQTGMAGFLQAQATDTLLRVVHLRDNATSETVQLSACVELLNRYLGKPVQRTEQKVEIHRTEERITDIDITLKQIEEEEARLKGASVSQPQRIVEPVEETGDSSTTSAEGIVQVGA